MIFLQSLKLKDNLYWVGALDKDLRVFDIIMETKFGTTYNSYLLLGSEKKVLFETAKEKFFDDFSSSVKEICDLSDIDYIVVNHTEPDHAGSIEKILDINPDVTIVGTVAAMNFLKEITNRDFKKMVVKDGDTLSLGDVTLTFYVLPNLHWPDTMYTYINEYKTLVTCDSFGSHYADDNVLRSKITDREGYIEAAKYYFDNILGPFKNPFMIKGLNKAKSLNPDMICPGHGPVLDSNLDEIYALYEKWCNVKNPNDKKTVVIPYVSAYGYTKMLAETIANGIKKAGDIDVKLFDMVTSDENLVLNEIAFADGILFGTPTILGEALKPIWNLTINMYPPIHGGKFASAFGSYGWSGEGVPHIIEKLKQLKLKVQDGFRVKFKPSEKELSDAENFGENFGKTVLGI